VPLDVRSGIARNRNDDELIAAMEMVGELIHRTEFVFDGIRINARADVQEADVASRSSRNSRRVSNRLGRRLKSFRIAPNTSKPMRIVSGRTICSPCLNAGNVTPHSHGGGKSQFHHSILVIAHPGAVGLQLP
jgi:hypothetical protein